MIKHEHEQEHDCPIGPPGCQVCKPPTPHTQNTCDGKVVGFVNDDFLQPIVKCPRMINGRCNNCPSFYLKPCSSDEKDT